MPNLRVQKFIYRNLVQRPRVNRFLDRFGNGINAFARKIGFLKDIYATGLTRNKAILFSSLIDPKIPATEVGAAKKMLLYSDSVRAFLAVVKDYNQMRHAFPRNVLRDIAEKLRTKGLEVSEEEIKAALKTFELEEVLGFSGEIFDRLVEIDDRGKITVFGREGVRITDIHRFLKYDGKGGWKLHLTVKPDNYEQVDRYLFYNYKGIYKLLFHGKKDFTIYIGSMSETKFFVEKFEREIGYLLEASKVNSRDYHFTKKIAGRFDVDHNRKASGLRLAYDGREGVPFDKEAMHQWRIEGDAFDIDFHVERMRKILTQHYGKYFTG